MIKRIVQCGECSHEITLLTIEYQDELTCPKCLFTEGECWFPDKFY